VYELEHLDLLSCKNFYQEMVTEMGHAEHFIYNLWMSNRLTCLGSFVNKQKLSLLARRKPSSSSPATIRQ
jgi:hypothetical protein